MCIHFTIITILLSNSKFKIFICSGVVFTHYLPNCMLWDLAYILLIVNKCSINNIIYYYVFFSTENLKMSTI